MMENLKTGDKIRLISTGYRKAHEVKFVSGQYVLILAGKSEKMISTEELNRNYEIVSK